MTGEGGRGLKKLLQIFILDDSDWLVDDLKEGQLEKERKKRERSSEEKRPSKLKVFMQFLTLCIFFVTLSFRDRRQHFKVTSILKKRGGRTIHNNVL